MDNVRAIRWRANGRDMITGGTKVESFMSRSLTRRKFQPLLQLLIDASLWVVALPIATALRFQSQDPVVWSAVVWTVVGVMVAQVVLGLLAGLYRRRLKYGSSEELLRMAAVTLIIGLGLGIAIRTPWGNDIRYSVPSLAPSIAVIGMVGVRLIYRNSLRVSRVSPTSISAVIVGAGDAAYSAVRLMMDDSRSP